MHNTPTSLSFSLVVFLAPPQGRLRVAEQQSDRAVSLFSLSLQVNKSPSESRATYTPTLLQSLNDTKETSQRVCVVFFFFSFPILHSFFSLSSLLMLSDSGWGGGFALQPRWMENKLMIKAWPLSALCHFAVGTMLRGRKGEKCHSKKKPLFTEVQIKPDFDLCGCTWLLFVFI